MTREEMIETARQVRARNPFPPATPEELAALPADEKEFYLEAAASISMSCGPRPGWKQTAPCSSTSTAADT